MAVHEFGPVGGAAHPADVDRPVVRHVLGEVLRSGAAFYDHAVARSGQGFGNLPAGPIDHQDGADTFEESHLSLMVPPDRTRYPAMELCCVAGIREIRFMKLWFALFSMATLAVAQTPSASVVGRVTDPTGAVIPGVAIKVTNVDTNISQPVSTNETGDYTVPFLNPGRYMLEANA